MGRTVLNMIETTPGLTGKELPIRMPRLMHETCAKVVCEREINDPEVSRPASDAESALNEATSGRPTEPFIPTTTKLATDPEGRQDAVRAL